MNTLGDVHLDLDLQRGRRFQVVGFGENAVDLVCEVPRFPRHDSKTRMESMVRLGGGTVATACVLCARFGLRTRYVGRIGDDEPGEFSRGDLAKEPLDLDLHTVPGASSHFSVIIVDQATGGRTIIWNKDPGLRYRAREIPLDKLLETQCLLLDSHDPAASVVVAKAARTAGVATVLDIDRVTSESEELLSLVDIAIPSLGFLREFVGDTEWRGALETLGKLCSGLLGVTMGEQGAAFVWEEEIFEFPSFPVDVVDSTAAGDVFHGAFMFAVLQGRSLGGCVRFSNAAGALACTHLGARASIPSLNEVLERERRG